MADTKQYQKTQSRSSSRSSTKIIINQNIKHLILNPFDTIGTQTQTTDIEIK